MFKLRLCVYCAVRTESLGIIHTVVSPKPDHVVAQAGSRRSLTADARVRSQFSPCEMCVGQSDNGTGFSPCLTERSNEVTARLGRYSNMTLPEREAVITSFKILYRRRQIRYRITNISGCRLQNVVTIFIAIPNGLTCNLLGVNYWHSLLEPVRQHNKQNIYPNLSAVIWNWRSCTSPPRNMS
jgi:hypothetical protein